MARVTLMMAFVAAISVNAPVVVAGIITVDQSLPADSTLAGGFFIWGANLGQSFTPGLSSINEIDFWIYDDQPNNGAGGQLQVVLHDGSFTGTVLASSDIVSLSDGYGNTGNIFTSGARTEFVFPTTVSLTPGHVYVAEVKELITATVEPELTLTGTSDVYSGGTAFVHGSAASGTNFFFQEGLTAQSTVTPEPSTLTLLGAGLVFAGAFLRRARRPCKSHSEGDRKREQDPDEPRFGPRSAGPGGRESRAPGQRVRQEATLSGRPRCMTASLHDAFLFVISPLQGDIR